MVSKATLEWTTDTVMLYAITSKHLYGPIIPFKGNRHLVNSGRMIETFDDIRVDLDMCGRLVELVTGRFECGFRAIVRSRSAIL